MVLEADYCSWEAMYFVVHWDKRGGSDDDVIGGEMGEDFPVFSHPVLLVIRNHELDPRAEVGGSEEERDYHVIYVVEKVAGEATD